MQTETAATEADGGRCAYHPERGAVGICARCGSFHCADCFRELAGRRLCAGCLALPGIDYLRELRSRLWGKRDGWVWYFGLFGGFGALGQLVVSARHGQFLLAAAFAVALVAAVGYLALQRWARLGLYTLAITGLVQGAIELSSNRPGSTGPLRGAGALVGAMISALFVTAAWNSTRSKLAFRIEVSEVEIEKLHASTSNGLARRALAYGILSLFVPLLGVFSAIAGWTALRRLQPDAWPPVGGKPQATWGLWISVFSTLMWCGFLSLAILR